MTPVAFALFIIALVWPMQRRLKAVLPRVIAGLATAGVALLAIGSGGWLVVWGFGGVAHWVIDNATRLQGLYMHAADLLEQRGFYAAELFAEQINVSSLVQLLRAIGGSLQGVLSFWAFTAVYGLELHREWGVIAFVLNFIPFIGSFIATLLPTLFGAAQFESLSAAVVVFIGLNLLQFVIGSYIEPRVAGTAVSVSPFMVLFAVFFWGMLWGIAGAFIGVPILIALATVCARHPLSRPIAVLLSADGTTKTEFC